MLIKIIKCVVNKDSKDIFHLAQTKWTELKLASGFITQLGGWNVLNKEEAVVIALWESLDAYNYFMTEIHDKIMNTNEQQKSYEKIEVSLWQSDEIFSSNDITSFKHSVLVEIVDYEADTNYDRDKIIFITDVNSVQINKVLIFNNKLVENKGIIETVIELDKDWTI